MKKRYAHQHNELQDKSRRIVRRSAAGLMIFVSLVIAGFVGYDLLFNRLTVTKSTPADSIGYVAGVNRGQVVFDEPTFSFTTPIGWEEIGRDELAIYNTITFQNQIPGRTGRQLKIYIDTMPNRDVHEKASRVAALETNLSRNEIQLIKISPQCYRFTEGADSVDSEQTPDPIRVKWQDADFLCNADRLIQTVATSTVGGSTGFVLKGSKFQHRLHLLYTDHTSEPDYTIFEEILYSLRVK